MKIFTIIFVTVIVLGIVGFFASAILSRDVRANIAEHRGDSYIHKVYGDYTIAGKNCQGEDVDGDSYVSCDYRIISASSTERVVHLQCPIIWKAMLGSSCKESRIIIPSQ